VLRILLAAILFLVSASLAQAAVCTVHVDDLNFGVVDAIANTPAMSTADVAVSCDGITPGTTTITVCGNIGEGSGGVAGGVRQSIAGAGSLGFVLYAPGGSVPWGSLASPGLGAPYRIDVPVSGSDGTRTVQLEGVVPQGQAGALVGEYRADFDAVFTYAEGDLDCAAPVGGTDAHASFAVTASVVANCLLETSDLDFGTAGIIGHNIDADTELSITCTPGTGYSIAIDGGGAGDPDHRMLHSGTDTVSYGLYSDSHHLVPWGTDPGSIVAGEGNGNEQRLDVHGRIPPQPAVAGAYADTVVVTITYE
jgi:spore coat protein U-like protein